MFNFIPWAQAVSRACPLWSDKSFCSDTRWQTLWAAGCCTGYQRLKVLPLGKYLIGQAENRSDKDTTQWPDGYKCHSDWTGTVSHVEATKIGSHMDIKFSVLAGYVYWSFQMKKNLWGELITCEMLLINMGVWARGGMGVHHTLQLHVVWAVVMDHSEQCSSITNIPHQVFKQWEEGQLSARSVLPTIPYLTTRGRALGFLWGETPQQHNTPTGCS